MEDKYRLSNLKIYKKKIYLTFKQRYEKLLSIIKHLLYINSLIYNKKIE